MENDLDTEKLLENKSVGFSQEPEKSGPPEWAKILIDAYLREHPGTNGTFSTVGDVLYFQPDGSSQKTEIGRKA